jgi:hypothetical protein
VRFFSHQAGNIMNTSTVYVITVAHRQADDSFETFIDSICNEKTDARSELQRIKHLINTDENLAMGRRARTPISQIDDLSVQMLKGAYFYECQSFYSIRSHLLNHALDESG